MKYYFICTFYSMEPYVFHGYQGWFPECLNIAAHDGFLFSLPFSMLLLPEFSSYFNLIKFWCFDISLDYGHEQCNGQYKSNSLYLIKLICPKWRTRQFNFIFTRILALKIIYSWVSNKDKVIIQCLFDTLSVIIFFHC